MRILVVADGYRNGEARAVEDRASALVRRGHLVVLLAGADPRRMEVERAAAVSDGLDPELVPHPAGRGPAALLRLARAFRRGYRKRCKEGRFDAVLLNQPLSAWAVLGARPGPRGRTLYTFHAPWAHGPGGDAPWGMEWAPAAEVEPGGGRGLWPTRLGCAARRWIEGRALRRADRITVLSQYMRARLLRIHPWLLNEKISVIPGGVDLKRFVPPGEAARRVRRSAMGFPAASRLLVTVRPLAPRMGIESLLRAFRMLALEFPDLYLVIGGAGPMEEALRRAARELGIAGKVRFLGFVPDAALPGLYAAADLSVLPAGSLEGFDLEALESLASGTPVVAAPVGAAPELLHDIDRRLLARSVTPEGLREAIGGVLRFAPAELRALGERARRRVTALYDAERVDDAIERLLLGTARMAARVPRISVRGKRPSDGPPFARPGEVAVK